LRTSWTTLSRVEKATDGLSSHTILSGQHSLYVKSPYENCTEPYCTKQCFVRQHFSWCVEHSAPSAEEVHGTYHTTEVIITRVNGQMVENRNIVEKPKCALAVEQESNDPDCNVVQSGQSRLFIHYMYRIEFFQAYNIVRVHGVG
jgi:hypothetical protein